MTRTKNKNWFQRNWIYIFSAVVLVLCAVYVYRIFFYWKLHPSEAGQFGDMFGAVTALIGSLTFIFLIYSINLQREELELAREEYKLGLAEMQEQTTTSKAQLETNKALQETTRIQRIETTFFNLIQLFQNKQPIRPDQEIQNIHWAFREQKTNEFDNLNKVRLTTDEIYYVFEDMSDSFLGSRYNTRAQPDNIKKFYPLVMNILTFLKECELPIENKQVLANTFLSLLSQQELLMVFYHMRLYRDFNNHYIDQELFEFAQEMKLFHNLNLSQFPHSSYQDLFRRYRRN